MLCPRSGLKDRHRIASLADLGSHESAPGYVDLDQLTAVRVANSKQITASDAQGLMCFNSDSTLTYVADPYRGRQDVAPDSMEIGSARLSLRAVVGVG